MLSVTFSEDARDFARRDWRDLVRSDPAGTFFHTPRYLKAYWEEFHAELDLLLAFVERDGEAVGACAFERLGGELRFLGGTEVTDYLGPVATEGMQDEVAVALVDALVARDDWDSADLRNMPEDSAWLPALQAALTRDGLWHQTEDQDVCPYLPLPETWDEYLAKLPSKLRHEIKRKARRLESEAGEFSLEFATRDTLAGDLERFVELHRSSEGPKGKFMQPGMEIFFRRLADAFLDEEIFRLGFLRVKGERVAGAIGYRFGDRFYLYNSAFDHAWRPLSVGMVLVGEMIRACIEDGLTGFDMLKGGLEYKYRFGSHPRRLLRLQVTRSR
jgi:CelD/BcsL family acetyltransferase involved in cellulose biosynthesis